MTLRRLASLTGAASFGAFLFVHVWVSASATRGQVAYEAALARTRGAPYRVWEILLGVAVVLHAAYGLAILSREGLGLRGGRQRAGRLAALVAAVFVACHVAEYPARVWLGRASLASFYATLSARLSSTTGGVPLIALAYTAGLAACAYHAANGLRAASETWGLAASGRGHRNANIACAAFGVIIFALGADALLYFATGTRLFVVAVP